MDIYSPSPGPASVTALGVGSFIPFAHASAHLIESLLQLPISKVTVPPLVSTEEDPCCCGGLPRDPLQMLQSPKLQALMGCCRSMAQMQLAPCCLNGPETVLPHWHLFPLRSLTGAVPRVSWEVDATLTRHLPFSLMISVSLNHAMSPSHLFSYPTRGPVVHLLPNLLVLDRPSLPCLHLRMEHYWAQAVILGT